MGSTKVTGCPLTYLGFQCQYETMVHRYGPRALGLKSMRIFFLDFSDFLDFLWKTFFGAACIDPSNLTLVPRETVPLTFYFIREDM